MATALELLDIRTYHSLLWFSGNLGDLDMWNEAIVNKFFQKGAPYARREWDQLFYDFGAISSDDPAIAFAVDLILAYPEAKVIIIERSVDKWFASFDDAVIKRLVSVFLNSVATSDV